MSLSSARSLVKAVRHSVRWISAASSVVRLRLLLGKKKILSVSDRRSLNIYCAASALSITINRRCVSALNASARAEARRPDTNTCLSCVPLTIRCKLFTSGWWPNNMFKSLICMRALPHITKSVQIYYKFFKYAIFLTKKFQNHGIYTKYI